MCKGVALRIQLQIWTQERSVTSCCHPPYVVSFTLSALTSVSHSLRRTSPEQKRGPFHTLQYSFADYSTMFTWQMQYTTRKKSLWDYVVVVYKMKTKQKKILTDPSKTSQLKDFSFTGIQKYKAVKGKLQTESRTQMQ